MGRRVGYGRSCVTNAQRVLPGTAQVPQLRVPPQPSSIVPQGSGRSAHRIGTHALASGSRGGAVGVTEVLPHAPRKTPTTAAAQPFRMHSPVPDGRCTPLEAFAFSRASSRPSRVLRCRAANPKRPKAPGRAQERETLHLAERSEVGCRGAGQTSSGRSRYAIGGARTTNLRPLIFSWWSSPLTRGNERSERGLGNTNRVRDPHVPQLAGFAQPVHGRGRQFQSCGGLADGQQLAQLLGSNPAILGVLLRCEGCTTIAPNGVRFGGF